MGRLLFAAGVVVITTGAVAAVLFWLDLVSLASKDRATSQLDALKIGLSVGVGSGGVFALYLAARRQRTTELDLTHRASVQAAVDTDATERRITELYTKAADQLGSDKAVVQLAGLYAMERLAQGNSTHRQIVVDVLCGYLHMPFTMEDARSGTKARATMCRNSRSGASPNASCTGTSGRPRARPKSQTRVTGVNSTSTWLAPLWSGLRSATQRWGSPTSDAPGSSERRSSRAPDLAVQFSITASSTVRRGLSRPRSGRRPGLPTRGL